MKRYEVAIESSYVGADEEYEFEMPDDATEEEIEKEAYDTLMGNFVWHYEEVGEQS